MNRNSRYILALASALMLFLWAAPGQAAEDPYSENRLLQYELSLASKPDIYFIVDLEAGKIYFKSRGMVLKEAAILGKRLWGRPPSIEPMDVVEKTDPFTRKLEEISSDDEPVPNATSQPPVLKNAPASPNKSAFEVNALELKDMPVKYTVKFENGLRLIVWPESAGPWMKTRSVANKAGWYVYMPVMSLWKAARKEPLRAVEITLNSKDAQALYWALLDKDSVIFYIPSKQ